MKLPSTRAALRAVVASVSALSVASAIAASRMSDAPAPGATNATAALPRAHVRDGRETPPTRSRDLYIVRLAEPPLALYTGSAESLTTPPRDTAGRLDPHALASTRYVAHLRQAQQTIVASIAARLQRQVLVRASFQHALNALVMPLQPQDVDLVRAMPGIAGVEAHREYPLLTDRGPTLIGAPALWGGNLAASETIFASGFEAGEQRPAAGNGARGEGMVVGMLDTGINFANRAFAAVGDDGYTHANPLGADNYLGTCAKGQVDSGRCNAKVFGAYDFVCGAPGDVCLEDGVTETPGAEDDEGHGSHTASTVAGNARVGMYRGNAFNLSGVAPHANLVAFDVCYINPSTQRGSCPSVSLVAAVDQAVADGVVDTISYSIGGGSQPWDESVSLAFLGAAEAGIFIAAAAGNDGPDPGFVEHNEPWVTTVGASTHDRGGIEFKLDVTGPGTPPANVRDVVLSLGTAGSDFTSALPPSTPLIVSPGYLANLLVGNDGCNPFPAGTFAGGIAVLRRGACTFVVKATNARNAGALAAIMVNSNTAGLSPSGTTGQPDLPVFGVSSIVGTALRAFAQANGGATARIDYPATITSAVADVVADFSSRGPASVDVMKPDITAPGVDILAADAGDADAVALLDGTSMATPHVAGASLLIRQLHPDWTPAEIKSALLMTANHEHLDTSDGQPATPFDRGSGRAQVDRAARAGLVMRSGTLEYLQGNPALTGAAASTINLPSLKRDDCTARCVFTRRVRNPGTEPITWRAEVVGLSGDVSPATFTLAPGLTRALTISVDTTTLAANTHGFGEVVLTALDSRHDPLHWPVALRRAPARIAVTPQALLLTQAADTVETVDLRIANTGGDPLHWDLPISGSRDVVVLNNRSTDQSGFASTLFQGRAPEPTGFYTAEDLTPLAPATVTRISVPGFVLDAFDLQDAGATSVTFKLYRSIGVPAGNPEQGDAGEVYSCTRELTGDGSGGFVIEGFFVLQTLTLDLATAAATGCAEPPRLEAQPYWLSVQVAVAGDTDGPAWYHFLSLDHDGATGHFIAPRDATLGPSIWTSLASVSTRLDFAARVEGIVDCELPSWIDTGITAGTTASGESTVVTYDVNTQGLSAGLHRAHVCVSSDDTNRPSFVVPIELLVE